MFCFHFELVFLETFFSFEVNVMFNTSFFLVLDNCRIKRLSVPYIIYLSTYFFLLCNRCNVCYFLMHFWERWKRDDARIIVDHLNWEDLPLWASLLNGFRKRSRVVNGCMGRSLVLVLQEPGVSLELMVSERV